MQLPSAAPNKEEGSEKSREEVGVKVATMYQLPRRNPKELFYLVEYSDQSLRKMSLAEVMGRHPQELSEELIDRL